MKPLSIISKKGTIFRFLIISTLICNSSSSLHFHGYNSKPKRKWCELYISYKSKSKTSFLSIDSPDANPLPRISNGNVSIEGMITDIALVFKKIYLRVKHIFYMFHLQMIKYSRPHKKLFL